MVKPISDADLASWVKQRTNLIVSGGLSEDLRLSALMERLRLAEEIVKAAKAWDEGETWPSSGSDWTLIVEGQDRIDGALKAYEDAPEGKKT